VGPGFAGPSAPPGPGDESPVGPVGPGFAGPPGPVGPTGPFTFVAKPTHELLIASKVTVESKYTSPSNCISPSAVVYPLSSIVSTVPPEPENVKEPSAWTTICILLPEASSNLM